MKQASPLIRGTIILTLAGLLSKVFGFLMRIFLSRYLGAEGLGIVQLVNPLHVLGVVISSYGIQTAISRFVSSAQEHSAERIRILKTGLILGLSLAAIYALLLFVFSPELAGYLLQESQCTPLLRVIAICAPLETFHMCVHGYYYGKKRTGVPAVSQLLEQSFRLTAIWVLFSITTKEGVPFTPIHAVLGSLAGDIASGLFCLTALALEKGGKKNRSLDNSPSSRANCASYGQILRRISTVALPLTCSQTITHVFHSVETVLLPTMLRAFGYDNSKALSLYGILTGMALPLILFPSTLTNSFAVLLLPTISEAYSRGNHRLIDVLTRHTVHVCLLLGIFSTGFFVCLGNETGLLLYNNTLAGSYIVTLGFLCPFIFLNMTLSSVLNGLGRTSLVFRNNLIGLSIRIFFAVCIVPKIGIYGYFFGFLLSSFITTLLLVLSIRHYVHPVFEPLEYLCKPIVAIALSNLLFSLLSSFLPFPGGLTGLFCKGLLLLLLYGLLLKLFIREFSLQGLASPFRSSAKKE